MQLYICNGNIELKENAIGIEYFAQIWNCVVWLPFEKENDEWSIKKNKNTRFSTWIWRADSGRASHWWARDDAFDGTDDSDCRADRCNSGNGELLAKQPASLQ